MYRVVYHVVTYASLIADNFHLMHNHASPGMARAVSEYLRHVGIPVIESPPRSRDMYSIEHLLEELKQRFRARIPAPVSLRDLAAALVEGWENIPQDFVVRLIGSMNI